MITAKDGKTAAIFTAMGHSESESVSGELVIASGAAQLLARVRKAWKHRNLIERVERLLPVDPSSACQRLLNAAIRDLKEKIVLAGLDIARQVANDNKLPQVSKPEDVLENLSTSHTIDLSYRMGLLSRAEWRRVRRCYEIRRDLEHEDADYEATIEDCIYIFRTCVESVLAKDPVQQLRVADIKAAVESAAEIGPTPEIVDDFRHAPDVRQEEVFRYLLSKAGEATEVQVVQVNAVEMLRRLQPGLKDQPRLSLVRELTERLGRSPLSERDARVANAAGLVALLPKAKLVAFYGGIADKFESVGYSWRKYERHADLFDHLDDVGGLDAVPEDVRRRLILWMVLAYLGEPGGYGMLGRNRQVFYSDSASGRIRETFDRMGAKLRGDVDQAERDKRVIAARKSPSIDRRFQDLLDLVTEADGSVNDED